MMHKPHRKGGPSRRPNRRPLDHGDLGLLLLSLIQETPRHGYDLMTQIETRTGGAYKPSPGVIYPALEVLQDMGQVEINASGTKKIYRITKDGQTALEEKSDNLIKISERLDRLASPTDADDGPSVRAAVHRLHHTIKSHMKSEDVSETEREKIVAILDEACQKVGSLKENGGL